MFYVLIFQIFFNFIKAKILFLLDRHKIHPSVVPVNICSCCFNEGCLKSNALVVRIQKVFIIMRNKIALQHNPLLVLYTPANYLEAFGFHSGVILYWNGQYLGSQPVKAPLNFQNEFHKVVLLILEKVEVRLTQIGAVR